ncbi:hypothetical protein BDV59DRAFT_190525 [Aspergillus ambiguus]|uniref:uncharacterized protein n=1 Tax=Aspergillus ambiguus TaxID=176160 RepID=UPI003CCDF258
MEPSNILQVLEEAAGRVPNKAMMIYDPGNVETSRRLTYGELRDLALANSAAFRGLSGFERGSIVLLHLDNHTDNIVWLWSLLYAGCIPAMSTPFAHKEEHRRAHLLHLKSLLHDPVCLTRETLRSQFPSDTVLRLQNVESVGTSDAELPAPTNGNCIRANGDDSIALLMLTSGSTGYAKAVPLTHHQLLISLAGKQSFLSLREDHATLNWIALDHVASLIEMHFHPMFAHMDQVHVHPTDVIPDPLLLLQLIHRHRVEKVFAPNFLLAKLQTQLQEIACTDHQCLDLSCLRYLVSGGEANVVQTCAALARRLGAYKAPENCIVPSFGMTETCAGFTWNTTFPAYDVERKHEFASVGRCEIEGIRMRTTSLSDDRPINTPNEGYYNNPQATKESFTVDGWFRTGDLAIIDETGNLNLMGRTKELILESAIEDAKIPAVTPSFTTEQLAVVYLPTYEQDDINSRLQAQNEITRVGLIMTGARPYIVPLDKSALVKTSLGKLSRNKIKNALEAGRYRDFEETNSRLIKAQLSSNIVAPSNDLEALLLKAASQALSLVPEEFGVETTLSNAGHAEKLLCREVPMFHILSCPTVRCLAKRLENFHSNYDPVVTIQPRGSKTPLWLVHPVGGEVLVFVSLSNLFNDRPVHGLRARGLNRGETPFSSIRDAAETYHRAIKQKQPDGPYALAGYSYGSLIAYEVCRLLDQEGDTVQFFGSLDLPPYHARVISEGDWTTSLLHLASSIGLISEEDMISLSTKLQGQSQDVALQRLLQIAPPNRLSALDMTSAEILRWSHFSFAMTQAARGYEPCGNIQSIDVFYTNPSDGLGVNSSDWLNQHRDWARFSRLEARYHELQGLHYRLLSEENVHNVYKCLSKAMCARGL